MIDYFSRTCGVDDYFIAVVDECLAMWHQDSTKANDVLEQIEVARQTAGRLRRQLDGQRRTKQ